MSAFNTRPVAASIVAFLLGCGPAVSTADTTEGGTGSGGDTDVEDPPIGSSSTGGPRTTGSESGDESTGTNREPVCGDGITELGEACDDGNVEPADGCSPGCEVSGTLAWTETLPGGYAVGLSAATDRAVVAIQQWDVTLPSIALEGRDRDGTSVGSRLDVGGFSDFDIAREPVAMLADGSVALGYAVVSEGPVGPVRHFGMLDPSFELVSEFVAQDEHWTQYYGTTASAAGVFVLHDGNDVLVLEQFDAAGDRVATLPLDVPPSEHQPLFPGAVPKSPFPAAVVLTVSDGGGLTVWENLLSSGNWSMTPAGEVGSQGRPSSFSDGVLSKIWNGAELGTLDELNHVVEFEPRAFEGRLLWADTLGLVVGQNDTIVLYDAAGTERLTVVLDGGLSARFVRPDPEGGGLFVAVDEGIPVDKSNDASVVMLYLVR